MERPLRLIDTQRMVLEHILKPTKEDCSIRKKGTIDEIKINGGIVAGFTQIIKLVTAKKTKWNNTLNELEKTLKDLPDKLPTKWATLGTPEWVQAGVKKEKDDYYIFFLRLGDGISGSLKGYIGEAKGIRTGECEFKEISLTDAFWDRI